MGIAGNIYKGRVTRVLPGMQAAFVDIGLEKAAFLHGSDLYADLGEEFLAEDGPARPSTWTSRRRRPPHPKAAGRPRTPIEERLKKGQEILVQVAKEPIGTKGARVTSSSRCPAATWSSRRRRNHIGVSRRIEDENERGRA